MSTRRTPEEQIAYYSAKIAKIKQEQTRKARNARTKRLIEIGATVEKALDREITKDELPELFNFLKVRIGDYGRGATPL